MPCSILVGFLERASFQKGSQFNLVGITVSDKHSEYSQEANYYLLFLKPI